MKKAIIISLVLILVLIVSGCDQVDVTKLSKEDVNKVIVCEKPYIRFASGCCLDKNENKLCDNDESVSTSTNIADKESARAVPESVVPEPIKEEVNTTPVPIKEISKNSPSGEGFDLADYPFFFGKEGNNDLILVVGDNAPSSDVVGATDIATSLQYASRLKGFSAAFNLVATAKLSAEVSYPFSQDMIVLGNPCVNPTSAKLLGNPKNCTEGFEEGKAVIKLFVQPSGNVALLVAGYSAIDTRRASRVVAEYQSWQDKGVLNGTEVEVAGTSFTDITVNSQDK